MACSPQVVVVGAGIGGLVAALDLAVAGLAVTVVEKAAAPGGKMHEVEVGGARIDAGPTVFTMRGVFEEIFADAGASLDDAVVLRPCRVLARHAWPDGSRLDLFGDIASSADAIGVLAGADEARRFRLFALHAQQVFEALDAAFMRAPHPGLVPLIRRAGIRGLGSLLHGNPFVSLWRRLGTYFRDPRLRQLFGRYATYCGSSPFAAPAILMLIAHVERDGVWLVEGGMHRLARALAGLGEHRGVTFVYRTKVEAIEVEGGQTCGVRLATGERLAADIVVANADTAAISNGLLGERIAHAVAKTPRAARSLSAMTWALKGTTTGFPLLRHTVFFSSDYVAEFRDLFDQARLPREPTVYVCAQDREDCDRHAPQGAERLFCLVNAPANGDSASPDKAELDRCEKQTFSQLQRAGLQIDSDRTEINVTTPSDFHRMFPGTGGALYGRALNGWRASFQRPTARTRIPGLYLAGGSTHPGPGIPMAALSGRMAASCILADLASTNRS